MRLLDVSPGPHYPPNRGGSIRVCELLSRLSDNHEVRQFCATRPGLAPGSEALPEGYEQYRYGSRIEPILNRYCKRHWFRLPILSGWALRVARPPKLLEWLDWADVVMIEYPWQLEACRKLLPRGRFVMNAHNVEYRMVASLGRGAGVRPERGVMLPYVRRLERRAAERADRILAVSPEDAAEFVELYRVDPAKVIVIPNGANIERIRPACPQTQARRKRELSLPDRPAVIFASSEWPPGLSAAKWIERIAPLAPEFTFVIAGSIFSRPQITGNVVVTGPVPAIEPWFEAADIGICPVEFGAGTKLKLVESLAAGLPTVAFRESVTGTCFEHEKHLIVSEKSEASLVEGLRSLANDPAAAAAIGLAAREVVEQRYDWQKIAETLEASLLELTDNATSLRENLQFSLK